MCHIGVMCVGLWALWLAIALPCIASTHATNLGANQQHSYTGSGEVPPLWKHDEPNTIRQETQPLTIILDAVEKMASNTESLKSRMKYVEDLILNQTKELKVTLTHELKVTVNQTSCCTCTTHYQKDEGVLNTIARNNSSEQTPLTDNTKPFVLYTDDTSPSRFYGDNSSLHQEFEGWCDTNQHVGFAHPVTHRWMYHGGADQGAWWKDPLPQKNSERTQIWIQLRVQGTEKSYTFKRFDNYTNFVQNTFTKRNERPWSIDGVGSIIYQGYLLFHYHQNLYRHNLQTGQRSFAFVKTTHHTRRLHMYVRYHAHEYGLWISYPNSITYKLTLTKVNVDSFELVDTVTLDEDARDIQGIWIICGVVWVLPRNYDGGEFVARSVYDVHKGIVIEGEEKSLGVLYGDLSQMSYNPREKVMFGWDNYHLLTWPLLWKKRV